MMRNAIGRLGSLLPACLCAALLTACADGGSSASKAAAVIPAGGPQSVGDGPRGSGGRASSVPTCSTGGSYAFVGGGQANVVGAYATAVLGGVGNEACDDYSA